MASALPAWANVDGAEEALGLAKSKLGAGDSSGAMKMVLKSLGMYDTETARAFRRTVEERIAHEAVARRILGAADHYEVLGVARTKTVGHGLAFTLGFGVLSAFVHLAHGSFIQDKEKQHARHSVTRV